MASGDLFVGDTVVGQQLMSHPNLKTGWIVDISPVVTGFRYNHRLFDHMLQADALINSQYYRRVFRIGLDVVGSEPSVDRPHKPSKCCIL